MSLSRFELAALVGVIAAFCAADAAAQTPALNSTSFQAERFEPMPAQGINVLNLATSEVLPHDSASGGLFLHFAGDLLVQEGADGEVTAKLIENQLKAELWGAFGFHDWFDLGFVLPLVLSQSGEPLGLFGRDDESVEGAALGDLRVLPKVRLINPENTGGIGLAILTTVLIPTGDRTSFNSDGTFRFEPRLALDWRRDDLVIGGNLAYAFRPKRRAGAYISDDAVRWGLGSHIPLGVENLGALVTLFGDVPLNRDLPNNGNNAPIEVDLAVQYRLRNDLVANVGGGTGITGGVGSPSYRVFGSIGYVPRAKDSDGDGLLDGRDSCPEDPEDNDGFQDEDGCPDHDNDGDGVLDVDDQCDMDREDLDGFEDPDGCPDDDNDKDGVLDAADECPNEAGQKERNGCPEGDQDEDGVYDDSDQCVGDPEDKDGFQDEDGCPDLDNDGDGVPDTEDQCPLEVEDKDGYQDEDGCPDPDNDGDGISDVNDKCPMQAETVDGKDDEDGCPEDTRVRITMSKIEILEKVFFATGKAEIRKRSFPLLEDVATVLNQNPQLTKIRIEGHTDDRGDDKANQQLSEERAAAVRTHLIEVGKVAEGRLTSQGYGETRPIADNKKSAGRDQNRRVEFVITELNGEPLVSPLKQPTDPKPTEQQAPPADEAPAEGAKPADDAPPKPKEDAAKSKDAAKAKDEAKAKEAKPADVANPPKPVEPAKVP